MNSKEINGYQPCSDRRFKVSGDSYSQERFSVITDAYHKLRIAYPYFAGGIFFGSLSKGRELTAETAPKTDLDICTFFDFEALGAFLRVREGRKPHEEVSCEPLVMEAVRKTTAWLTKYCPSIPEDKIEIHPLYISGRIGSQGSLEYLLENYHEQDIEAMLKVAAPFALDIGSSLGVYRRAWLGRIPNSKYELVNKATRSFERNNQIPPNLEREYPKTQVNALAYYS